MPAKLISIEEARTRVLTEAAALPSETIALSEALGSVLAEDIIASHNVPPFNNSGMDGYAVRASDTVEATADSPVRLPISDTLPAGHVAAHGLQPGEAIRIMTGAPLPDGADTVVQSELTSEDDGYLVLVEPVKRGKNIRRAGEDIATGDRVLSAGVSLGPAEIGVLASLGHAHLLVQFAQLIAVLLQGFAEQFTLLIVEHAPQATAACAAGTVGLRRAIARGCGRIGVGRIDEGRAEQSGDDDGRHGFGQGAGADFHSGFFGWCFRTCFCVHSLNWHDRRAA